MAEKNEEAALMWLDMWERVDDENPQLWQYRLRLRKDLPGKLARRLFGIGKPIRAYDLMIAAHALSLDLVLVTNNEQEFQRIPDLIVENWVKN